jgi:hypothetical protein
MKIDLMFLDKQVNKITDINELSILFFKLKKLNINEHKKIIKLRNEYESNNKKVETLMEKIVIKILETIDQDNLSEKNEEEETTSEEEEDELKSDDIQLLTDSDDEDE